MRLYDADGSLLAEWNRPARYHLEVTPPTTQVALERYDERDRRFVEDRQVANVGDVELEPGTFRFRMIGPGLAPVFYPVLARRGAGQTISFAMLPVARVPDGLVAIPAGAFQIGVRADENARRYFYTTQPVHDRTTAGYLIGRYEVTLGDWIRFLDDLPPQRRAEFEPRVRPELNEAGLIDVHQRDGTWVLELQPLRTSPRWEVRRGQPIAYPDGRTIADWTTLPVTGIAAAQMEAYARWLADHGVPGARMCTDLEWERAARGADARRYPTGDTVLPADANFDQTYASVAMGPDPVGAHPASESPFGLQDTLGNAFELVRLGIWTDPTEPTKTPYVGRGGAWYYDISTCELGNRNPFNDIGIKNVALGFRICADWPAPSVGGDR